jgi:hypothetical protein
VKNKIIKQIISIAKPRLKIPLTYKILNFGQKLKNATNKILLKFFSFPISIKKFVKNLEK